MGKKCILWNTLFHVVLNINFIGHSLFFNFLIQGTLPNYEWDTMGKVWDVRKVFKEH